MRDPDIEAPALSKFAEHAWVFPRTYAACPARSREVLETGVFPHAAAKSQATLAGVLRAAGYHEGDAKQAPFFWNVTLDNPALTGAAPEDLHLRENVPADAGDAARTELAKKYAGYAAMDREFGKLLESIDLTNTIVVFTSDGGEQIGSHGLDEGDTFYEESVRVPLAMAVPGYPGSPNDALVSQVDIAPTLASMCGVDLGETQGRDLSPLIVKGSGEHRESVLAEGKFGQREEWRMLVVGVDKLVTDAAGDATHLFNLAADPFEMKNVVREKSSELKRAQMLAIMRAERSKVLDFRRR